MPKKFKQHGLKSPRHGARGAGNIMGFGSVLSGPVRQRLVTCERCCQGPILVNLMQHRTACFASMAVRRGMQALRRNATKTKWQAERPVQRMTDLRRRVFITSSTRCAVTHNTAGDVAIAIMFNQPPEHRHLWPRIGLCRVCSSPHPSSSCQITATPTITTHRATTILVRDGRTLALAVTS